MAAPRKHPAPPPIDNAVCNNSFGMSLTEADHQLILQLSLHFERMENAMLSAQATNTNCIRQLEKQVASITAELQRVCQQLTSTPAPNKPTGKNPERGRSGALPAAPPTAPLATPCPQKIVDIWGNLTNNLSWADRLNAGEDQTQPEKPFITIDHKKKELAPQTVIPKAFPHTEREVILTLEATVTDSTTTANQALQSINAVIRQSADITHPPFILAYITSNNRLVLTSNPTTKASAYVPFL
jgi:hypothetical protein